MPEKTINKLILDDGTVLDNCECGYYNRTLWCYLKGFSFNEAFALFSDSNSFKTITFEFGIDSYRKQIIYKGLTSLIAIEKHEFTIDVRLEGTDIVIEEKTISPEANTEEE